MHTSCLYMSLLYTCCAQATMLPKTLLAGEKDRLYIYIYIVVESELS